MTAPRFAQATPRGPQWRLEPAPSRWRVALKALAVIALFLSCGVDKVQL